MSRDTWAHEYTDHQVWRLIDETIALLDGLDLQDVSLEPQVQRIRVIMHAIAAWREVPSPLVSQTMLTALDTAIRSPLKGQLDVWLQNNNPIHATRAHQALEDVLQAARGWPSSKERSLLSAAATVRESTRASKTFLETLDDEVDSIKGQLREAKDTFDTLVEKNHDDVVERFELIQSNVDQAEQELDQLKGHIDTAVQDYLKRFTDAEEGRLEKHQENLERQRQRFDDELDEAVKASEQTLEAQEASGSDTLARIKELKTEVENVVGAIGTASTANWYMERAENQSKAANFWRWGAIGGFALAFTASFLWITLLNGNSESWRSLFVKSTLTFTLLAAASYAIRESTRHRKAEFEAKKTELTLRALDPFIANVRKPERERMKLATARDIFLSHPEQKTSRPYVYREESVDEDEEYEEEIQE